MNRSAYIFLFVVPALIWGSTWYVIKFQLGKVDPLLSVSYRFLLGSVILFTYIFLRGLPARYPLKAHLRIALQGMLLFGFNYWFVYQSEETLPSALVAITFSTLIFMNIIFSALFMKTKISQRVVYGAILGVGGTVLMFYQEIATTGFTPGIKSGLIFCIIGVTCASLGNVTSAYNQKLALPVVQSTAYGMLYGGIIMFMCALVMGRSIAVDFSAPYIMSLLYLSVFGSVIAFTTYLTLIGKIGADKAGYVIVTLPVIALIISSLFEDYQVTLYSLLGMAAILAGNLLVVGRKKA